MAGILLPVCSTVFSLLLIFVYFSKERIHLIENRVFSIMLFCVLIDSILVSAVHSLAVFGGVGKHLFFIKLYNKIDFTCLILFANCLLIYNILINYPDWLAKIKKLKIFLVIVDIVAIISIFMTDLSVITQNGNFSITGPSVMINYAVCAIFVLLSIIITLLNITKITKKHIPIIMMTLLIILLFFIFSYNPYLVVVSISLTFINYLMYFTIENPDLKMIKQLEIAKEQADKANQAKTDFLSSMSHEIRTPLNAIVGFSDCIMNSNNFGEAKENARDIVNASGTLLEIVNGILDISKIEAGRLEIINSKYRAKEVFLELAKLIKPKMDEKGLDFTYKIAEDLPPVLYGDHANIKKVVTNLLSNACKYTDKGYVHYEVSCINQNELSKLIITVEDSGRGIKKDSIDKLFTKFQRLDEDKNTTIEGTGLGLAITKQLTELMGGKIIVHTVYGEGSKFTVILTQKIEKDSEEEKKVQTTLNLKDVRILLVDDTPLNLKVAKKLLERYQANHIITCESGFECLERIGRGEVYDLILLDDMMPKMSGVETLKKLKENPNFSIPTVALTANAISGMREKYLKEGFTDYLAKPIEKEQLIRVCNQILGRNYTEEIPLTNINRKISTEPIRTELIPNINHYEKADEERKKIITQRENKETSPEIECLDLEEEINPMDIKPIELIKTEEETKCENTQTSNYKEDYLKNNGVDLDHALELLGDMEMYNMTIHDFVKEVEEKWARILQNKDSNNMADYAIDVHSLKSDCKYLGFMTLADIAYQHELKSKENDSNYVREHFQELEDEYKKVLEITRTYVENNPVNK